MTNKTVQFSLTSKGRQSVLQKQYEFVKHREYANGTIQWRCKLYQKSRCQARITTEGDQIITDADAEHNHGGNKESALARQAISQMKLNMGELSASTSNVIGSVSRDLEPGVLMALPKKQSLKRTLQRKRRKLQTAYCTAALQSPMDTNFTIQKTFQHMILHDSGPGNNRLILLGSRDLLDGLARAKLWLADGTLKVVPSLFFQLYTVHFELVPGLIPAAVYCLVENKTRATYDRILDAIKTMIPTAAPECVLLDFETTAVSAFRTAFPTANVRSCYFHLTQSVLRKVNEIGMKCDYESDNELRTAVRCLPALAMVPSSDVVESFLILADSMPDHEKMPELLSYFEHTYIRGRRRPGRGENYGSAIFPIESWNHYEAGAGCIARTNAVEGWHFGLQALFQCHHPTLWTFIQGIEKDLQMQRVTFLQGMAGTQPSIPKRYKALKLRVQNTVDRYLSSEILVYLRAVADISHV
ncbi:unnamed protein product [Clavelina lepadiformis]|uniref:MULE transposase domain-containing protein n=1 Tax=Clavelina lepadiformis TaxID=159417 RepID=A0ABP0GD49_CLALP